MRKQDLHESEPEGPLRSCRLLQPVLGFADELRTRFKGSIKGALTRLGVSSQASRFVESGKCTRITLMEQLSPIAETLIDENKVEYDFETPDSSSILGQTERKTLASKVLYRALGEIHGILNGSASVERLKINIVSIGSEYGCNKSARVTYEILMKDGSVCASENQHIIDVSN